MRSFVMLDIETLDTKNTAKVMQIGITIAEFKDGEFETTSFCSNLNYEEDQKHRTASNDTLEWWDKQDPEVIDAVFNAEYKKETVSACYDLKNLLSVISDIPIFAKGSFDFDILENLFNDFGVQIPWNFRQKRDYRTMLKVAEDIYGFKEDKSNSHNAMDDAVNQAENLIKIFRLMKTGVQR